MSEDLVISDINGICRLCLKDNGTIIPIFGIENTSRDCIPLSKKILDCVSIKVVNDDGLPSMVCVGCVHQLDSWHGFKNTCETSQRKLSSWLKRHRPDVYEANEKRKHKNSYTSGVIDLSSEEEDDDVVITKQGAGKSRMAVRERRPYYRSPRCSSKNIEIISIGTNEIEIVPLDDVHSIRKENETLERNKYPSTRSGLDPTVVISELDSAPTSSFSCDLDKSNNETLCETPDGLQSSMPNISLSADSKIKPFTKEQQKTVDITNEPSQSQMTQDDIEPVQNEEPPFPPSSRNVPEEVESMDTEPVQEDEPELSTNEISVLRVDEKLDIEPVQKEGTESSMVPMDGTLVAQELSNSTENCQDQPLSNDNSSWSASEEIRDTPEIDGIDRLDKNNSLCTSSTEKEDKFPGTDTVDNTKTPSVINNVIQEQSENCVTSSSLIIEQVTSLKNSHMNRSDEDSSKDKDNEPDVENVNESCSSWSRLSHNEEASLSHEPDIVLCDSPMGVHIKEEPLSAGEITGDEEDPLNFQCVSIKGEFEEWTSKSFEESEVEDLKPNVQVLNEALENLYTPKRLKNGKVHCEACRVSFGSDVYYERHATSMRHKWNLKLFQSGKAPTRKRGKSLIQAMLTNNYDYSSFKKGPFQCNQCPSAFKHLRNLKTHQKKHMVQVSPTREQELLVSEEPPDAEPVVKEQVNSSKPPQRQSALNNKFIENKEILMCDLCNEVFATNPALISHKRYCGSSENQCNICQQSFTTLNGFLRHRKTCLKSYREDNHKNYQQEVQSRNIPAANVASTPVPLDGTVLACTLCNLTFQTSTDLITHMQQNHMDFGKPQSPVHLPKFMKTKSFGRSNISMRHYCKYCSSSFTSLGALSSHTGYHARRSLYCCKFCKQSHQDKVSLRQHMKVHISDPSLNKNICWICYTPFSSQKDLNDHKAIHANMKLRIFTCNLCGNSYNTKELLGKHRKSAHGSEQSGSNNEEQPEAVTRKESKVVLIDEDYKPFKCKVCKKKFTTLGNLKRHNLIHKTLPNTGFTVRPSGTVDHVYQNRCNGCHKAFKTQSALLNHKQICVAAKKSTFPNANSMTVGNFNKPLKCSECKKWFASKNSLYKHRLLKRCRPGQANVAMVSQLRAKNCPNCDQQFLSEESLERHKQHCKPTIERLTCDCGEVFSTVEQKQTHADSCLANCTCKSCNVKFNSPEELESHKSICQVVAPTLPDDQETFTPEYRQPSVQCSKCNKRFVYTKCLRMHQDKCLYDRWPCSNCMEIFPNETALATHKSHKTCKSPKFNRSPISNSLSESPTFKCEYCPKRFTSGIELNQHSPSCANKPAVRRRSVSSVYRPWACDLCDKSFLWKANLVRHKKIIHTAENPDDEPHVRRLVLSSGNESPKPDGERECFKCNKCPDIIFHKKQGFLEHQLMHERQEQKNTDSDSPKDQETGSEVLLTCELCDKKLPESLYHMHMDEHMNDDFEESQNNSTTDEPQKIFPCDICGKIFYKKISRKSHRASHYREGDVLSHLKKESPNKRKIKVRHIRCSICNKLLSINSIHKHKMMHVREAAEFYGENQGSSSNKPVATVVSSSRSSTPTVAREHSPMPEAAGEQDSQTTFPCPKCDRLFKLRKSLIEHLKTHSEEGYETESTSSSVGTADQFLYKCLYCDLSWKYKSHYERHLTSKKHLEIQKQLSGII